MKIKDFSYFFFKPKIIFKNPVPSFLKNGSIFIKLTDDTGVSGWGEPNPYSASIDKILKKLKEFENYLVNNKQKPSYSTSDLKVYNACYASINQAIIEIKSKKEKIPIYKILNKKSLKNRVNLYASGGMIYNHQSDNIYYKELRKSISNGYCGYKFRPPYPKSFSNHIRRLKKPPFFNLKRFFKISKKIREIAPRDFKLMVDFGFRIKNYDNFLKIYEFLNNLNFYFIEEPIKENLINKNFKLKKLKLSGGESFYKKKQFINKKFNKFYKVFQPDYNLIDYLKLSNILNYNSSEIIPHNWFHAISNNFSFNCAIALKCKMIERNIYIKRIDEKILKKNYKINIINGQYRSLSFRNNLKIKTTNMKKINI